MGFQLGRQKTAPTIECDPAYGEFVEEVWLAIDAFGESQEEKGYLAAEFSQRVLER